MSFFLTASVSHGTVCFVLGLVGMNYAAVSIWALMEFSYSSFGVCVSDIARRISNFFFLIVFISAYGSKERTKT